MKDILEQFSATIRAAGAANRVIRIRAGGTKDFYGEAPRGDIIDPRPYQGIVDYDPSELVITARAGTPLAELEATLRERGQMLAFEPPHFGEGATVGGMVAAGLSGPRRAAAGSVRDFVLGARLMDGHGNPLTFGGQVMKNVAGYDVARLLVGSMGTLGLILEVSLKTLPVPVAEATLQFEMTEAQMIETLNRWGGRPLPISATAWTGGTLGIRLSGARAAVDAACTKLGGERVDAVQAERFWIGIREHSDPFFRAVTGALWRVSVPSTAQPLGFTGTQLVEWGGALRWISTDDNAASLRERATERGGHATLFRRGVQGGSQSVGVFTPLAEPLARIQREVRAVFDPHGIFNRGRMYPAQD